MLLSRTLARRRIAHAERPGFFAAWFPVLADWAIVTPPLILLGGWVMGRLYLWQPTHWLVPASLFVTVFVPMQAVVILSALWATRSRWRPADVDSSDEE